MKTKTKTGKNRLDKYYHLAKEHGYRSRSAFKIIQLAKKFNIFQNCNVLVDLCAAPGGWLQVASNQLPVSSTIIGVDLVPIKPIKGVITFQADIRTPKCHSLITNQLNGLSVDVVLHDGSPNMGCNWNLDAFNQNVLVLTAAKLACSLLRKGGIFVTKVFRSSDYNSLVWMLGNCFERVKVTKPQSSRNVSAEIFAVCIGFKSLKLIDPRLFNADFVFQSSNTPLSIEDDKSAKTKNQAPKTLNQLLKEQKKTNREGYDGAIYSEISVIDFLKSKEPATILVTHNKLLFTTTHNCINSNHNSVNSSINSTTGTIGDDDVLSMVEESPLTTEEIKLLCSDLKVAGKSDLQSLLKWRFKLINSIPSLNRKSSEQSESLKPEDESVAETKSTSNKSTSDKSTSNKSTSSKSTSNESVEIDPEAVDSSVLSLDKKLKSKIIQEKRRLERKQRKMLKKLKPGTSSTFVGPDPDLFSLESLNLESLTELSQSHSNVESPAHSDRGSDLQSDLQSDVQSDIGSDVQSDIGSDVQSDIGSDVQSDIGSDAQSDTEPSDEPSDELDDLEDEMSRLMKMEVDLEVRHSLDKLNAQENPKHVKLSKKQKHKLEQSNELKQFINKLQYEAEVTHTNEQFTDSTQSDEESDADFDNSEPLDGDFDNSEALDDLVTKRWFDNDIFTLQTNNQGKYGKPPKQDRVENSDKPKLSNPSEERLKLSNPSEENVEMRVVPAISNSEREELLGDPEKLAEFQALGSLMINKKTRMALIDGAYNKRTFTDEDLPSWFVEDENKHNKPQYPVTKELVKKYKQKLLELKNRPIKKVLEAKHRKAQRAKKRLRSILPKIEAISNDRESTENPKKLLRGLKKIQSTRRQKVYVISRRANVGKLSKQSKSGKSSGKGARKVLKHVDRRMKQDNRRAKIKPKRKSRKIRPH
ncbi:Spb1 domain protein [Theileria parva strain Muguga]|uniref:Putative rRNA methyltransferase n=1 Tax=Theileria parva TaxID=5875 RepID=Q4N1B5_THEPA|nr:Spb1 domain protein [Theileria parva strain Muguga]EAN32185.1 Spb1 domain protein [Theileria parva strain Muguga]|eukprot:XP_764468.1 rRNA methyltransferase [Theileria parva strain Muguga]